MSLPIWRATPYCHANVAQLWSSLSKTGGVASLWRYGVCLSRAEGHPAVTDPRFPPTPFPPNKRIPRVRTKLALTVKRAVFLVRLKSWGWGSFPPLSIKVLETEGQLQAQKEKSFIRLKRDQKLGSSLPLTGVSQTRRA